MLYEVITEVNLGREPGKSGVHPENLPELLEESAAHPGIRICGLMAIPPIAGKPEEGRRWFAIVITSYSIHYTKLYDARVHVVTDDLPSTRNLVRCVEKAGLEVVDLVLSPLASAEAVLTPEEKEVGVALLDFGDGTVRNNFV